MRIAEEQPETAEFCICVLEEVRTPESVSALLAIGGAVIDRPGTDVQLAVRVADGFNRLLSYKGSPEIDSACERRVREFLHRLLALELPIAQRALAVCALRSVGDEASADFIAELPPFTGCGRVWRGRQFDRSGCGCSGSEEAAGDLRVSPLSVRGNRLAAHEDQHDSPFIESTKFRSNPCARVRRSGVRGVRFCRLQ